VGAELAVRGEIRALGWREGSSGVFAGSLEGCYEGFRFGSDGGERAPFELELANGTLGVEVRQATNMSLPPRPAEHPFADGKDPIPEMREREHEVPAARGGHDAEAPVMMVELIVVPDRSTGIFAGARGSLSVEVPSYRVGGSLVVHTETGELWMSFLEVGVRGVLHADLWVDGVRSTGQWSGASGELTFAMELHHPNFAIGLYEGTIRLADR
jgi:hypothetical protein